MTAPAAHDSLVERVFDASALLAVFLGEIPREALDLERAAVSAVNWSEVSQKLIQRGLPLPGVREEAGSFGLQVIDFDAERAEAAAALWPATRSEGLGLGDRACLALARELGVPAVTADRAWSRLGIGVEVVVVRG